MGNEMSEMPDLLPCPFEEKFVKTDTCWNWIGAITSRGYGNFRSKLAHRVSYEKYVGTIPDGLTLDHMCDNKLCVNPEHLEPKTQYENNMRGSSATALNARKDVCVNGHPLHGDHIKIVNRKDGTRRKCQLCQKIYRQK